MSATTSKVHVIITLTPSAGLEVKGASQSKRCESLLCHEINRDSKRENKPVLKNLLKLYKKNWELTEIGNYRALAYAIFDRGIKGSRTEETAE